jgi:hypothetical protein
VLSGPVRRSSPPFLKRRYVLLALAGWIVLGTAGAAATESSPKPLDPATRERMVEIIVHGNAGIISTIAKGTTPDWANRANLSPAEARAQALRNLRTAAEWIVDNARTAPLKAETWAHVNALLLDGFVEPREVHWSTADDLNDRIASFTGYRGSINANGDPHDLPAAYAHVRTFTVSGDPIEVANRFIRYPEGRSFEHFPDANSRTGRLMADFILIQHGMGPALYTDADDYYARGSRVVLTEAGMESRSESASLEYFRQVVARGQWALKHATVPLERVPRLDFAPTKHPVRHSSAEVAPARAEADMAATRQLDPPIHQPSRRSALKSALRSLRRGGRHR